MKLLIVTHKEGGVEYHRLFVPHKDLETKGFDVSRASEIESMADELLKDFQVAIFSRVLSQQGLHSEVAEKCRKHGVKIVLDIDDYWHYSKNHLYYEEHIKTGVPQASVESITLSDYVVTTTPILADKIREFNKNVIVIENAIDTREQQFQKINIKDNRMRFGWFGSPCHLEDISLLKEPMAKLHKQQQLYKKYQIVLGGWTLERDMSWKFERILTDNHNLVRHDKNFLEWLRKPDGTPQKDLTKPLHRIYSSDTFSYAKGLNFIDVHLIPLADNEFNSCKSELKALESGFMGKAVIVSNVYPYKFICNDNNSMIANNSLDWYVWMRKCILNPNMVEDYAMQLNQDVQRYELQKVNVKREQLYKSF